MRRWILRGALVLTLLTALAAGAALLLPRDELARESIDRALGELSTRLGRSLTLGEVHALLDPPRLELRDLRLEGATAEEPSTLRIDRIEISPDLADSIFSLGHHLAASRVRLEGVQLRVERRADGTFDLLELRDRLSVPEGTTAAPGWVESLRVHRIESPATSITIVGPLLTEPVRLTLEVTEGEAMLDVADRELQSATAHASLRGEAMGARLSGEELVATIGGATTEVSGLLEISDLSVERVARLLPRLRGRAFGNLDLKIRGETEGADLEAMIENARATVDFESPRLRLLGFDLDRELHRPIRAALLEKGVPAVFLKGRGGRAETRLRDLRGQAKITGRRAALQPPLRAQTDFGRITLGGSVNLGGQVDLPGTATLSVETLNEALGEGTTEKAVELPFRLVGELPVPRLRDLVLTPLFETAKNAGVLRRGRKVTGKVRSTGAKVGRRAREGASSLRDRARALFE